MRRGLSRRSFLKSGAVGLAAPAAVPLMDLGLGAVLAHQNPRQKTEHVVLVAFAGGVRSKEVLGTPQNVPNLMRIASQGVVMPNVACENTGHYGAALSIFTGNVEYLGIRENERGTNPTVFEYLRKDAGFAAGDVWLSTAGGAQGRLFAHSDHPQYGVDFAANLMDGDGIFNVEFKKVLDSFGRPKVDGEADRATLDALAAALDPARVQDAGGRIPDPGHVRRVESFILEELSGATTRLTGPGAGDAKAIRIGLNILRVFRPKVLGITLQNADVAHGSFNSYVEVIRRNDQEIGALYDAIQQDPVLKDKTALLIVPEFGRDKNLNERNGLDHGDRSEEMLKVFLIGAGPDFRKNRVVTTNVKTIDVCPTILSMFSKKAPAHSRARVLRELF